jgi:microcystin-dependent protein
MTTICLKTIFRPGFLYNYIQKITNLKPVFMVGDIKLFAGNFAPQGWARCDGSLLPIAGNQALFAVAGTTYGGNGFSNFALPNLTGVENSGSPAVTNYLIALQ